MKKRVLEEFVLIGDAFQTKALLKSAQVFNYLKHANDYGLKITEFDKDFDAVVNRSRDVAKGMSKGVQFLMKKNKIEVFTGHGKVMEGKKVSVYFNKKQRRLKEKISLLQLEPDPENYQVCHRMAKRF